MRILMLCDGGGALGVGHVMRSLALAEAAVTAGHEVVVAGQFEGSFLQGQLAAAPVEVVSLAAPVAAGDLPEVVDLVGRLRPAVLHVDSYGAPDGLWELVGAAGRTVPGRTVPGNTVLSNMVFSNMVFSNMEDGTFGRRPAEVVVDPTFGAAIVARPDDGSGWLLRGSRYTPVRRTVISARQRVDDRKVPGRVGASRSVLVVMGGTDPMGLAPSAVGLLARTGLALEVTAIAVGENAQQARAAAQGSALSLTVLAPVDDLAALMSAHDLVVSAAGTSVWELCCIGVPAAVVWVVDNQREGYDRVVGAGAAIGLGGPGLGDERATALLKTALTDGRVLADLSAAGRRIVDGLGAWRVVAAWEQAGRQPQRHQGGAGRSAQIPAADAGALVARPATLQDAGLLWRWRNDPATRAGSRSSAPVSWDDHLRWLTASLARVDRMLLVGEVPGGTAGSVEPVGTVRWDLAAHEDGEAGAGHEWEVSITVAPQRRGQSLGGPLLRAAEQALSEATPAGGTDVTAYLAVVHADNCSSLRLFETSGYLPDLPPDPRGFMRFRKAARVP